MGDVGRMADQHVCLDVHVPLLWLSSQTIEQLLVLGGFTLGCKYRRAKNAFAIPPWPASEIADHGLTSGSNGHTQAYSWVARAR